MEDKILIEAMMTELNNHLNYALSKSGLRLDYDKLRKNIVLNHGSDRRVSVFMAACNEPSEKYPEGRIVLYIDAIADYSTYIGRDMKDVILKIFFTQVHHYLTLNSKGKVDYNKAEKFATRICSKLIRQGIMSAEPPIFYINTKDPAMYYQRLLRSQWFTSWSGINLNEPVAELVEEDTEVEEED